MSFVAGAAARSVASVVMLLVTFALADPAGANWVSVASGSATARADAIVAPTGLSSSCNLLLGRSVTLNWSAANAWAGYEVRWGTSSGVYTFSATTTATTYSTPALSGSVLGTQYYFVVRAIKGPWMSANSNQVSRSIGTLTCL